MKKFRMKVVCEATFVVTSPFAIEIEAEDEEAAEERAEEFLKTVQTCYSNVPLYKKKFDQKYDTITALNKT